ncbi:tetratricopeptide repeat protein [Alkaliphilus peptidifermentans]|uniref:Uncharacterized protein n=1 Tax=Alkaliphilus peptidifermentans DSM 18978 TaxID=1120976 RepID=A0A1G5I5H7_9FIRM|nr:hypothetical protein [Alkaliphilus peptidifermentans]SCY70919.1 hypothetical protein SAMN03080606_02253 [Alkaliphilus peptidifermentans DSM 18978]
MSKEENMNCNKKDRIGIWKARERAGAISFERDAALYREFSYWAWTLSIPLKSPNKRVVFIGDSVGMGHFYQPLLTPAQYLEKLLNQGMSHNHIDVIDLSCKTLDYNKFMEICTSSMILKPDALMIFIGNSWWDYAFEMTDDEIKRITSVKNIDNIDYMSQFIEGKLKSAIVSQMAFLNAIKEKYDIPIIFIIPEVNLKDWQNEGCFFIGSLNGGKPRSWSALKEKAQIAYNEGDYTLVEEAAEEMLEITTYNPIPYELLAKCKMNQGDIKQAKRYYRMAFNTQIYRFKNIPSSISVVKELILKTALIYGIEVLDLQKVFHRQLLGGIPGKDMFLDSCHLTANGIRVAMNHAALSLLPQIGGIGCKAEDIMEGKIEADEADEADEKDRNMILGKAHLLAAIHCQHEGQPYNLLYYHCIEALRYWPQSTEAMKMYIQLITAKVPWFIHKNYTELSKIDFWPVFPKKSQLYGLNSMEKELINAMVDALRSVNIDMREKVRKYIIDGFGPIDGGTNLLEPYYWGKNPYSYGKIHQGLDTSKDYGYYKEIGTESLFYLVADDKHDIVLDITLRIPEESQMNDEVVIRLNKNPVFRGRVCSQWRDYRIVIPKETIGKAIINYITIKWPLKDKTEWESGIFNRFHEGSAHIFPPASGNIIRFKARYL